MKKSLQSPHFTPDMPTGAGAWTASMISDLLTADTDPEFGLHLKMERDQPWTGIGEWRNITADEVSDDLAQLLPQGYEHSSLGRTWLSILEGAGEAM